MDVDDVDVDTLVDKMLNIRMSREGSMTGVFNISLIWDDISDLDLHVVCPSGEKIYYANKKSKCGGVLDTDMNNNFYTLSDTPIENIYWDNPQSGVYKITVVNFKTNINTGDHRFQNDNRSVPFSIIMRTKKLRKELQGTSRMKESVVVFEDFISFDRGSPSLPQNPLPLSFDRGSQNPFPLSL